MICLRCKEDRVAEFPGQRVCKACNSKPAPRVGKAAANYKPKKYVRKHKRGNDNAAL